MLSLHKPLIRDPSARAIPRATEHYRETGLYLRDIYVMTINRRHLYSFKTELAGVMRMQVSQSFNFIPPRVELADINLGGILGTPVPRRTNEKR